MADHQKIHPAVDLEAPPTPTAPPMVPHGHRPSSTIPQEMNEKCPGTTPVASSTIPREMNKKGPSTTPVDQQRHLPLGSRSSHVAHTIPVIPAEPKQPEKRSSSSTCCRCICWALSILLLVLIIIGATAGILYLIFRPKLPSYSVNSLKISDLRLNLDMSLYAKFDVKITAENPNKKIGIYYEQGGQLSVWYTNMRLCEGALPKFYQGHQNKTVLNVALTGQNQYGSTLMNALQQQQQTGSIPLDLKVNAPVAIELGTLKLRKVRILGKCLLVVDSLTTNNFISIKADNCRFRLKL
ncbi:PREDICTED: protein YLS9 [Fragaria vesca subsp. vesca]|uniref:protein YLS9 n=1 Tax=Fragaria vesca subsp. vesca TaxID=101020 RepID=UPI0002C376E3|nr:PREDICTED: protein YLS9 [Fragaria vesca subsp. vesca]